MNVSDFGLWHILTVISVVTLIIFYRDKNAVWGGMMAGVVIGIIIALVYLIKGDGFSWAILGKGFVLGVIFGLAAELLGMLGTKLRRKRS